MVRTDNTEFALKDDVMSSTLLVQANTHRPVQAMLLGLLAFGLSSQAIAQKGSAGLPASPETDPEAFLGQLGGDLKMAVRVQAMSSEDARTLWEAAAKLVNQGAEDKGGNDGEGKRDGGGHLWFAMRVPQGGDFRTLLRPEFIRRDIDLIVDRLALDETTAPIAESVLLDYEDAFETETSRFRDLLELGSNQVELANFEPGYRAIDPSNWNAVEVGIVDGLTERGVSDEKIRGTLDWASSRLEGMRTRLAMLEPMLQRRRTAIEEAGGRVDARDVLDGMNLVERRRRALRDETVESFSALVGSEMESTLASTLDEIRIQHGMVDSRMGGATTNIVAALGSVDVADFEAAELETTEAEMLDEIAILFDARTKARIRREKQALELTIEMMESGTNGDSRSRSRVRNAATAELTAELAVRDAILGRVDLIRTRLEQVNPEAAAAFLEVARRTGFRAQMRSRWCELATKAARSLEGLDDASLASLIEIEDGIRSQIAFLRTNAIQRRLDSETRIARAMVEAVIDDGAEAKSLGERAWREPGYEGFDRLDEQTETQLLGVLGPDRIGELPKRPGSKAGKDERTGDQPAAGSKERPGGKGRGKPGKR